MELPTQHGSPIAGSGPGTIERDLFDPAELDDMRDGDTALYERLLRLFVEQSAGRLATLRSAVVGEDWIGAGEMAHSVKGSSATVGALRMATIAKRVEGLVRAEDAGVHPLLSELEHAFEQTRAVLVAPGGPLTGPS